MGEKEWERCRAGVELNNLGYLDTVQNRMEEARKELDQALQIRRELAQKNPETYIVSLFSAQFLFEFRAPKALQTFFDCYEISRFNERLAVLLRRHDSR